MPLSLRFAPSSPVILCACGRLARSGISGCFYEINAKLRRDAIGVCQSPVIRAVDSRRSFSRDDYHSGELAEVAGAVERNIFVNRISCAQRS
jgi:hypothetical protein